MTYIEFAGTVEKMMNRKIMGGVHTSLYTAMKNNGTKRTGILIETPGINISPTIYLEEYYESYLSGKKIEQIVEDITQLYEAVKQETPVDCGTFRNYEGVRDRIVFKLVNTAKNRKFLSKVPHLAFLDLSIVFYILVEVVEECSAAMVIDENHMEKWQVSTDILWEDAAKNVKNLLPAEFVTMNHALNALVGDVEYDTGDLLLEKKPKHDCMYILSNKYRNHGAACIAYPNMLEMIGQILKKDYYILPSSVHEVIIVPYSEILVCSRLDEMVREVNATQVEEEEVLSNHVYLYDRITGKLRVGSTVQAGRVMA